MGNVDMRDRVSCVLASVRLLENNDVSYLSGSGL